MGSYSVPEEIRRLKPKGTMVKNISGHYYVYKFSNYTDNNGKRHTKMGKCIGAIKEGIGFVPNKTYNRDAEVTSLDFGEYAITLANSSHTFELLKQCFNPEDAATIYAIGIIEAIQGFTYLKDIKPYYDMSVLSVRFPSLKLGYSSLSKLYDSLGRRQKNVLEFEERLLAESSGQIAIDGHAIGSMSTENDLAEKGYKFRKIGEPQINLLMAYDVNTHMPLMSRIYEGASIDMVSVKDFLDQAEYKDTLFIIDRGFYSKENLRLFSSNGNKYIIPLRKSNTACRKAVSSLEMQERFIYRRGKKSSVIEYKDEIIDNVRVVTYRDLNESAAEQENYLMHLERGDKGYTKQAFEEYKDFMGVTVLQTNCKSEMAKEIYELYKKRWSIETFYNYFKNKAGYVSLHEEDYYKTQGLSFIMLVSSLIRHDLTVAVKDIQGKSVDSCLLEARMVKAHKRHGAWTVCNCLKNRVKLFEQLNTPLCVKI